jgi:hypothetical protein
MLMDTLREEMKHTAFVLWDCGCIQKISASIFCS